MPESEQCNFDSLLRERDACGVGLLYRRQASHEIIESALTALAAMEHRGACGADRDTGDGAGVLTAIPWDLLEADGYKKSLIGAVGVVYLPRGHEDECRADTEKVFLEEDLNILGWRKVPVKPEVLGSLALATCPTIEQVIVGAVPDLDAQEFDSRLMIARKRLINAVRRKEGCDDFYLASLSSKTIVYKGMVRSSVLREYYLDLQNPLFITNFAVFHRRFSTNTFPRWALAQPFRMLGHNGEINTLLGNRTWMRAREPVLEHPAYFGRALDLQPVISNAGSDSGNLDNALEMLVNAGHSPEAALMQLMPEAYKNQPALDQYPEIVDFYDYHSALQEPWDGPALIVYSDGRTAGAILDRNGLRPARYSILADGSFILSSETGVVPYHPEAVLEKGRLGPGQMIMVDLETGDVKKNWQIKESVARAHPYGEWVKAERKSLVRQEFSRPDRAIKAEQLLQEQLAFGYGKEDIFNIVGGMAQTANEPIFSMGDDTPVAVLSQQPRVLFDYFKQRFAQVTNPPIDPLREKLVMSLDSYLGRRTNLLQPVRHAARALHLTTPILNELELESLDSLGADYSCHRISLLFDVDSANLEAAVSRICSEAVEAVRAGKTILILNDRGVNASQAAIPSLLAVGAVHHHLIREGLRLNCSIIIETGQCWSTHHFACLLGYGAQAICPYLALETVRDWYFSGPIQALVNEAKYIGTDQPNLKVAPFIGLSVHKAQLNYVKAVEEGILKIISKMGISVLMSYIGAQIFECVGLGPKVIDRCFNGTTSRLGGLEFEDIAQECLRFHRLAFCENPVVQDFGNMVYRTGGEYHGNNPELVKSLHAALGFSRRARNVTKEDNFRKYSSLVREREPYALRDLLDFNSDREPVDLDEVESALDIVLRFCTGGMSLGALSKEAHEVLAVAMNRLGAMSNSGEGGEDPNRYYPIENIQPDGTSPDFPGLVALRPGDHAASAIRQVASARFGVTPEYLVTSKQLEIKIAQGAKPGEGGQLPAHKVSEYIGWLRRAKPNMSLISPPPHHDIYSIEDLAQLIFDLRQVNHTAKISVKLVSQIGIGTVAAGVAKADAEIVQISGHDGGTGASPLGSIKNAGVPWELGLAETHQVLRANQLRERVRLRVDGGLRSGWEVVTAAMLGADEFGFGSIALIAEGCIMARVCHTNNCPVGITSQKETLRKKFPGTPEPVVEFFLYIAEEVRMTLAQLGYRSIAEIVGRTDLLKARALDSDRRKAALDLECLLRTPAAAATNNSKSQQSTKSHQSAILPHSLSEASLNDLILEDADVRNAIENQEIASKSYPIINTDRTIGARISGEIARRWGNDGFQGRIDLRFAGSAGQSFGAFNIRNVSLELTGEANDYVGKGMNGGRITIKPPPGVRFNSWQNVLVGNTCLYGATGGALYVAGQAGERFAVRNSGALAVIEGAGDHCCEYMTGGTVVILGTVGRNFAAGMTGGLAYVLDEHELVESLLNGDEGKRLQRLTSAAASSLKRYLEEHLSFTGSLRAQMILENWQEYLPQFWQVVPLAELQHPDALPELQPSDSIDSLDVSIFASMPTFHND
ncbi:MAG TPA: glutamate synthase large subunit [Drouetiella sp.]|jgi:glutamate synthase (ferredoxin)